VRADALIGSLAGYSGTSLPRKLGIKPDARVALVDAPIGIEQVLGPLPDGVRLLKRPAKHLDVIVLFVRERRQLERRFDTLAGALVPNGGIWVAWPKKASGVPTDLTENDVREVGLTHGLVDNKVCAITEVWSGLRLVRRLRDR
jgi:hypothetical protein